MCEQLRLIKYISVTKFENLKFWFGKVKNKIKTKQIWIFENDLFNDLFFLLLLLCIFTGFVEFNKLLTD